MSIFNFFNQGKKFEVQGPPGATEAQARAIFDKQVKTGSLVGLSAGDTVSAATQAAAGLPTAQATLSQSLSGVPGISQGALNSFRSIAESTKQSLAAGTTGTAQERATNAGGILQQTGAKIFGLFGQAAPNPVSTAGFATTPPALMPMSNLSTTDVRATVSSVAAGVGQDYSEFSNAKGIGKFGLNATQLETAGLLKPGTASSFLAQGANDLTTVLKSPAVWTGKGGINSLDSLLNNATAQSTTQQQCMSQGLGVATALGVPVNSLPVKDLGGIASVFGKDSAAGTDWIRGQLPPAQQADLDAKFKDAQFAIGSADEKFNDAMNQMAPPGDATDTVDRETLTASVSRVFGNDKIPPIDWNDTTPRLPADLAAEQRVIINLLAEQRKKFDEVNATAPTAANANEKIAKLSEITSKLNALVKRAQAQIADIKKLPSASSFTAQVTEMDEVIGSALALIDDIRVLYLPNLRRIKG